METAREPSPELEIELLRKGIGDRANAGAHCRDCGRTPLIGERLYRYYGGETRCELCRPLRREEPVTWELVHGPEYGQNVVRITRTAA
jgi:hypothetical protein